MKVLAINPQFTPGYIHSARWDELTISGSHWYPIFLSYTVGLLEKHGHVCKLVDAEANGWSDDDVLRIAKGFKPDFTLVYVSQKGLTQNINLSGRIKEETESSIIFVGPWCSMPRVKEVCKKSSIVDHVIDGEFEFAVRDIVEGKETEKFIRSGRLTAQQLNELPWVTKTYNKHLNIEKYKIGSLWHPFVDMFTGRKCYWGKCTFCLWPNTIFKGGGYVARNIEDVIDEIEWAVEHVRPRIKEIFIQDDTPPAWRCKQIAEGIIERGIDISWSTYARGDLTLTPDILRLMKKSGCHCLHVGYESASNRILKNVNKGVTKEMLERFTAWCNDAGIDIHADFMIGLPGETEKTVRKTIEWAKKLHVLTYQFAPPKPYPCTPYYDWLLEKGFMDEDGNPNYSNMSYSQIVDYCKQAMKECYFNPAYLRRVMFKPKELRRLARSAVHVIPYVFSKRV